MVDLAKLEKLARDVQEVKEEGAESQRELMERADKPFMFEHEGFTLEMRKLPLPKALQITAKLPAKVLADAGEQTQDVTDLSPEEAAQYIETMVDALAFANTEGKSAEQIGRMTPPEYPADFLGLAFSALMKRNQMTKKQVESLAFFRKQQ